MTNINKYGTYRNDFVIVSVTACEIMTIIITVALFITITDPLETNRNSGCMYTPNTINK